MYDGSIYSNITINRLGKNPSYQSNEQSNNQLSSLDVLARSSPRNYSRTGNE